MMRKNYLYGYDDYLQWPQPFNDVYCHLSVVRCPPSPIEVDPDRIMWEAYSETDHFDLLEDGCISGFGKLKDSIVGKLAESVSRLLKRSEDRPILKALDVNDAGRDYVHSVWLNLKFTFSRVKDMPCTKEQANHGWVELQRAWLLLDALWEFLTTYRPRMTGRFAKASYTKGDLETRLMGSFTHDERVAQQLFDAGIPVWLIRRLSQFNNQNIISIESLRDPNIPMEALPQALVLTNAHTGSVEKFKAIESASHQFTLHPDPFEIAAFNFASTNPPTQSSLTRSPASGPSKAARARHSKQNKPYSTVPPQGKHGGKSCEFSLLPVFV
jgi:hypothetical protein